VGNRRGTGADAVRNTALEEMVADRIAEELIRAMFPFVEQKPSEVKEVMNSKETAEFRRLPYSSFREIALCYPGMPSLHSDLSTCGARCWRG
jgi:hypothetical protein